MGCWDETCAISGLPIEEGDECYRLVFDDTSLIAFCCIESFRDFFGHLVDIKFGTYNDYGGLTEDGDDKEVGDGVVFILKHFWDIATIQAGDDALAWWDSYVERAKGFDELKQSLQEVGKSLSLKWAEPESYQLYQKDPEIFHGFLNVLYLMAYLRRAFYTAGYRGAQSTTQAWKIMRQMNADIGLYLDFKFSSKEE